MDGRIRSAQSTFPSHRQLSPARRQGHALRRRNPRATDRSLAVLRVARGLLFNCYLWHLNISFLVRSNRHEICRQPEILVDNHKFVIPKGFCGLKTGWWRAEHVARTMCSTLPQGMYMVIYPVVGGGVDREGGLRHSSLRSPQRGSPHLRRAPGASRVLHALGLMIISWMRGCVLRCVLQRVVGITCCSRTPRSVLRSMAILALV